MTVSPRFLVSSVGCCVSTRGDGVIVIFALPLPHFAFALPLPVGRLLGAEMDELDDATELLNCWRS